MWHCGDPHTLTGDGIWHHRRGCVTHGDARQWLCHWDSNWGHRGCHRCHGYRWRHTLCNGLSKGSREWRDLRVQMGWWRRGCSRWRCSIGWGSTSRSTSRCHKFLLGYSPWLQSSAAQSCASLCDAMVVGAHWTNRWCQTLLWWCGCWGHGHDLCLAAELGILLQQDFISGHQVGDLKCEAYYGKIYN